MFNVQLYTRWILDAGQVLLLHLPHTRHVLVIDERQRSGVCEVPHGIQKLLGEGASLLNPSGSPAAVLGQFTGGDAC